MYMCALEYVYHWLLHIDRQYTIGLHICAFTVYMYVQMYAN